MNTISERLGKKAVIDATHFSDVLKVRALGEGS
jgi:hypothetical protein